MPRLFAACYDQGRKVFTRHFVLFVLERRMARPDGDHSPDRPAGPALQGGAETFEDMGGVRLGLTVSRKVGRAVLRNRVRRVLREFFRLHQAMVERPLDIVVVPKRNLDPGSIGLALVEQEFLPALSRLRSEGKAGTTDARSPC